MKHITGTQCGTEACLPYPNWNEDFSGREFEESSSPNVEEAIDENGRIIGLLPNVGNKRGSIKVHWALSSKLKKENEDCTNKTTEKKPKNNTETTDKDIKGIKINVTDSNRTLAERRSAPLVQVYVVASGTGGAHTNIGDGGFYGKNNGHAISTGRGAQEARNGWSGHGQFSFQDNKDVGVISQKPPHHQEWTSGQGQHQHWSIDGGQGGGSKDLVEIDGPSESDFRLPLMDDKISEASTKYHFNYHGINIKPESFATRTRRKILQNWHKGDLLNGYYRFWFRR